MSARSLLTLTIVAAGVLAPAANADAAKKPASKYPTVSKIAPMRVAVGGTMTITGKGFIKGAKKNTVVFRRTGKRAIFVKADGVSTTTLKLKVPTKLTDVLGAAANTTGGRFQIRVLARRFGKTYTSLKSSPTIVASGVPIFPLPIGGGATVPAVPAPATTPAATTIVTEAPATSGGSGGGSSDGGSDGGGSAQPAPCTKAGTDDDGDLLPDSTETAIKTDPCNPDSDGDGVEDGWEYQSAVNLKHRSCLQPDTGTDPKWDYPRPCDAVTPSVSNKSYPNPLNGNDAGVDYDGDWLPMGEEFRAFKRKGSLDASYKALNGANGMWYSDGKQASVDDLGAETPDNDCRGMKPALVPFGGVLDRPEFMTPQGTYSEIVDPITGFVKQEYEIYLIERSSDPCLNDAERDEDGDFLTNREEFNSQMSDPQWWKDIYGEVIYEGTHGGIDYKGTDWLDPNTDGEGPNDGLSDEDNDDFLNVEELYRGGAVWDPEYSSPGPRSGLWVNPFNPCLPHIESRTCPDALPAGGASWPPFAEEPPTTRWPLYRTPLYAGVPYPNPAYDPDDDPPAPETLPGPVEVWNDIPIGEQTKVPVHPLKRPSMGTP